MSADDFVIPKGFSRKAQGWHNLGFECKAKTTPKGLRVELLGKGGTANEPG